MSKNIYCGISTLPKGKHFGDVYECKETNQIRRYGLNQVTEQQLQRKAVNLVSVEKAYIKYTKARSDAAILLKKYNKSKNEKDKKKLKTKIIKKTEQLKNLKQIYEEMNRLYKQRLRAKRGKGNLVPLTGEPDSLIYRGEAAVAELGPSLLRGAAIPLAEAHKLIKKLPKYLVPVGSVIRKKGKPGDIDLVSVDHPLSKVLDYFEANFNVISVPRAGKKVMTIHLEYGARDLKVNVWAATKRELPYMYFSRVYPRTFIIAARNKAKLHGLKLNDYGLYKGNKLIPVHSWKDIFKILQIPYRSPQSEQKRRPGEVVGEGIPNSANPNEALYLKLNDSYLKDNSKIGTKGLRLAGSGITQETLRHIGSQVNDTNDLYRYMMSEPYNFGGRNSACKDDALNQVQHLRLSEQQMNEKYLVDPRTLGVGTRGPGNPGMLPYHQRLELENHYKNMIRKLPSRRVFNEEVIEGIDAMYKGLQKGVAGIIEPPASERLPYVVY